MPAAEGVAEAVAALASVNAAMLAGVPTAVVADDGVTETDNGGRTLARVKAGPVSAAVLCGGKIPSPAARLGMKSKTRKVDDEDVCFDGVTGVVCASLSPLSA